MLPRLPFSMKRSLALSFASFLAAPLLFAQGNGVENPAPALPAPSADTQGIPLIPQPPQAPPVNTTPAQDAAQTKKAGPSRTDAAEDAMQMHIKLRAAKTKALEDPAVQAELAKVGSTKTDYDRREAYKRYYVLLYARMLQIDPSIAAGITPRQTASFSRNYQYRVIPTVPVDQVGQPKPTGPENDILPAGATPPPRRGMQKGLTRQGPS
jgi:hypothetical protein